MELTWPIYFKNETKLLSLAVTIQIKALKNAVKPRWYDQYRVNKVL